MRLSLSIPAALLALAGFVSASNVVDLDPASFDALVGHDKPALVEFFAPWCGHCKNLMPTWEQLADAFPKDKVLIAKTDADGEGRALGERYGVQGFPTLKWFPAGSVEPEDYTGGRDLDSLVAFVAEKSGVKSLIKPPPPPAALTLDSSNFDDVVDGSKNVLVAFTAPWCGHCKNMKPAYEAVARAFEQENSHCIVANMNADEADNKDIAHRYGVRSFPTIKFFPKGEDEWLNYDLPRTEAAFTDFLNEHCGTQRAPGGILNDIAGRIASLDALASEFIADIPSRDDVLANAKDLVSGLKADGQAAGAKAAATADYYLKAMERIKTKGDAWLAKETGRLSNLLASSSLAPAKLDEIKVKINILKQFVAKKAGELFDDAEAAAQKIVGKDEL